MSLLIERNFLKVPISTLKHSQSCKIVFQAHLNFKDLAVKMLLSALQPFQSTRKAMKKADICEGTFSNLIHILN
jgi:hypothetical protein